LDVFLKEKFMSWKCGDLFVTEVKHFRAETAVTPESRIRTLSIFMSC
jgi:hypothetical protein